MLAHCNCPFAIFYAQPQPRPLRSQTGVRTGQDSTKSAATAPTTVVVARSEDEGQPTTPPRSPCTETGSSQRQRGTEIDTLLQVSYARHKKE